MTCDAHITSDARIALEACRSFLATDPLRHNVIWTLLERRAESGTPGRYAWVTHDGSVTGMCLQSPPTLRATLSPMPAVAVEALVAALRDAGVPMPGVTGPATSSTEFATTWGDQVRTRRRVVGGDVIYATATITSPTVQAGSARRASQSDAATLVGWLQASHAETGELGSEPAAMVEKAIAAGQYWVWDVDGPVSMAASTRVVGETTRIRGVYTPRPQRSNGYAAACVAAVSQHALANGVTPMLYTDRENPASNAVYRRIGFEAIDEAVHFEFG